MNADFKHKFGMITNQITIISQGAIYRSYYGLLPRRLETIWAMLKSPAAKPATTSNAEQMAASRPITRILCMLLWTGGIRKAMYLWLIPMEM
jgi:hypothetical protein